MAPLRIAIATPRRDAWSETFIAAHLDRLRDVVLVLTDGTLPKSDGTGRPLLLTTRGYRFRNRYERSLLGLDKPEMLRRRISTLLRDGRVDVVLAEYGPTGEELLASCQMADVPLVVHFHGYDAHERGVLERYNGYRRLIEGAAAFVVVSRAMEEQLLSLGAPREKVFYNCYGVDVERFRGGRPDLVPPHFLTIGRFVEKKAPLLALLAFHRVVQQCPGARLTMVGTGVLWESTLQVVKALGLTGSVDLCGVRTPEEVAVLMQRSRAFMQHSVVTEANDSEGTPLAILEAMATGIPVVATRHAGIADVIAHGERGLLCGEFDIDTMAELLLQLADDPVRAARLGAAGRAYVQANHRVENSIASLHRVLALFARTSSPRA